MTSLAVRTDHRSSETMNLVVKFTCILNFCILNFDAKHVVFEKKSYLNVDI